MIRAASHHTESNPRYQEAVRRQKAKERARRIEAERIEEERRQKALEVERLKEERIAAFFAKIEETARADRKRKSVNNVIRDVAQKYGYTLDDMIGPSSKRPISRVRHLAVAAVKREYPKMSLPEIGRKFGGRDHTTILNSLRRAAEFEAQEGAA